MRTLKLALKQQKKQIKVSQLVFLALSWTAIAEENLRSLSVGAPG